MGALAEELHTAFAAARETSLAATMGDAAPPEPVKEETPAADAAPVTDAPEPEPDEEEEETTPKTASPEERGKLTKELRRMAESDFISRGRGKRMYETHKALQSLATPPAEDGSGGLGFIPTPDEIRDFHNSHQNFEQLQRAWASGSQEGVKELLHSFMVESDDGKLVPEAKFLAENMYSALKEVNPDAASSLQKSVFKEIMGATNTFEALRSVDPNAANTVRADTLVSYIEGLEKEFYANSHNPKEQKYIGDLLDLMWAKELNQTWRVNGQPRPPRPPRATAAPKPAANPERDAERAELEKLRREAQGRGSGAWDSHKQAVNESIEGALRPLVSQAVKPLQGAIPQAAIDKFVETTLVGIANDFSSKPAYANAFKQFDAYVRRAAQTRQPDDLKKATDFYSRSVEPMIAPLRKQFVKEQQVKAQADAAAASVAKAAGSKPASGGGGAPARTTVATPDLPTRQNGETQKEYLMRLTQSRPRPLQ